MTETSQSVTVSPKPRNTAKSTSAAEQSRTWAFCGMAVFTIAAIARLATAPTDYWRWRDDAVITLSHALGFALNGVPSVSASAERLEGYSAPLQFLLSSLWFLLGGSGWEQFLDLQVVVGMLASGYFLSRYLQRMLSPSTPSTLIFAVMATAVTGFWTWGAIGWFGSGMENSLTVPLLFASMAAFSALDRQRGLAMGFALGLCGISRAEWFVFLLPAIISVIILGWRRVVPRIVALRVCVIAGFIWLSMLAFRYSEFGSFVPNSAKVQAKSSLNTVGVICLILITAASVMVAISFKRWHFLWPLLTIMGVVVLLGAIFIRLLVGPQGVPFAAASVVLGGFALLALALVVGQVGPALGWLSWAVLATTPVAQFMVFGFARLDSLRLLSMAFILMAPAVGVLAVFISQYARSRPRKGAMATVVAAGLLGASAIVIASTYDLRPRELCCDISEYSQLLSTADEAREELGVPRVILANPDLGKVSFPKETVTTDLGLLGDALLAQVVSEHPEKVVDLLNRVVAPDVASIHLEWLCTYQPWVESEGFTSEYFVREVSGEPLAPICPSAGRRTIFQRKPSTQQVREAQLASRLAADPFSASDGVSRSLDACAAASGDELRCEWVRRAIQRAAPELRTAGVYDSVTDTVVEKSPASPFDGLLLTTPPGWSERAADWIYERLNDSDPIGRLP